VINSHDADVLLIYTYADTHQHAYGNLKYFIKTAVRERDGIDYYFILQQVQNKSIDETQMPELPKSNAFYIQHENKCFDFGTIGWFIDQYTIGNPWTTQTSTMNNQSKREKFSLTRYKYFIFMNSSIRGPFFPPYFLKFLIDYQNELKKSFPWYHVFTKRINNVMKLTGCTINCEIIPHVQSYFLVTDFTGLSIMLKPGNSGGSYSDGIFGCYSTKQDVTSYSELPMSNRIREAGYMIDCLLTKYQTINFTAHHNRPCNGHVNPYKDKALNGLTLEPYEVVFVKYNDRFATTEAQERAKLYQQWMDDINKENRSTW
jgi:hypothetical protein